MKVGSSKFSRERSHSKPASRRPVESRSPLMAASWLKVSKPCSNPRPLAMNGLATNAAVRYPRSRRTSARVRVASGIARAPRQSSAARVLLSSAAYRPPAPKAPAGRLREPRASSKNPGAHSRISAFRKTEPVSALPSGKSRGMLYRGHASRPLFFIKS